MSRTRWAKIIIILILAGITELFMAVAPEIPTVTILGFFVVVAGIFLGLDIKKMIAETKLMKPGDFEPLHLWKFLYCGVIFAGLTAHAVIVEYWSAASMAGGGLFVVAGSVVAGLTANKEATSAGKKSEA